ncbi:MAG: RNA polymerase sigma factor, partial [Cryobacterium sp.]|nr:RNA polymerase sigma factor [Cryobacterium sp.]
MLRTLTDSATADPRHRNSRRPPGSTSHHRRPSYRPRNETCLKLLDIFRDAEEIVAETYAIAWRRRSDMPAPPFRRAWLFGVARTLLLAEQRRHQRERNTLHDAAHALAERPYGSESADDSNAGAAGLISSSTSDAVESKANAALAAAMKRLTPMQREVLTLTAWECLTPGELAVVLVIKPGAARVRLHRARQALAADPQVRALAAQRQPVGDALQI